jgi:hypothetical protein
MAVDFGWPWWAFTTIAVVVAATSLLMLRLVSSRLAHGVLITLLVEAVVIAALAPAVMTATPPMTRSGGKASTNPQTSPTGMGVSSNR